MIKKIIIISICTLLITPFIAEAKDINYNSENENKYSTQELQVDVPTWQNGDNWKYNMQFSGELGEAMSFNWIFENTIFTITSDTGSTYTIDIKGDVIGEINIFELQLISGSLKETTMIGTTIVDKSNIGFKDLDAHISGKIAFAGIPLKTFTMDIDVTFNPSYSAITFPLSVGKKWTVPISDITGTADISLLNNPVLIDDIVGGDYCECTGIETLTVPAGTYEAYKILSDEDVTERYYSTEVGNYIKAYGDVGNTVDIILKSTNYGYDSGAPNKPSRPQGTNSGTPGKSYSYTSFTTDNEGDQIYYWFDWGDGTNSGWLGPFNSGDMCSSSKSWNSRGTFSVKVKAKDTEEHISKWSDPLSVIMPKNKANKVNKLDIMIQQIIEKFPNLTKLLLYN
ncbi:MAG: hypothetical protein JSV67_00995 [Thermoplasmatales archaeon]|nr:MAG: hypothetical protein JSV67_00995 [Thermoplasmatales archaeon]